MAQKKPKTVTIRMYRQGLGDCFLITFPPASKPFYMLVDCGALSSNHYDKTQMEAVVKDIKATTGGHLDIVAVTHEHWDHISGFTDARDTFKDITIGKIFVAWTEMPDDQTANALKKRFKKKKKAVRAALARLPADARESHFALYKSAITELFNFSDDPSDTDAEKGRTAEAWDYILGRAPKIYGQPKDAPLTLDGVEGVRIYVLGPPDDPDFVKKKLSKKETYHDEAGFSLFDSFLAAVDDTDEEMRQRALPFDQSYSITPADAQQQPFFRDHYGFGATDADAWRRIDNDWLNQAGELALHLDSYTNNTCLAFAIELIATGQVLLFPGDAQVGNWLSWDTLSWTVKDAQGHDKTVKLADLLARAVFYKVGHHGSHNATLREHGLEKMNHPDFVAMIPVHRLTAQDKNWQFPFPPLWKRLQQKARGRVILADATDHTEIQQYATQLLTAGEWADFQARVTHAPLYVEYDISY